MDVEYFAAIWIAIIGIFACGLDLRANYSNVWMETKIRHHNHSSVTNITCTKGLWEICCSSKGHPGHSCILSDDENQDPLQHPLPMMCTLATCVAFGAMFCGFYFLYLEKKKRLFRPTLVLTLHCIAALVMTSVVTIYSITYQNDLDIPKDKLEQHLAIGFWLAVAGGVLHWKLVAVSAVYIKRIASRHPGTNALGYLEIDS